MTTRLATFVAHNELNYFVTHFSIWALYVQIQTMFTSLLPQSDHSSNSNSFSLKIVRQLTSNPTVFATVGMIGESLIIWAIIDFKSLLRCFSNLNSIGWGVVS